MSKRILATVVGAGLLLGIYAGAQQKPAPKKTDTAAKKQAMAKSDTEVWTPDKLQWGPAPAVLPAGAQLAVLEGNPMMAGPYTMRLKMPDGYKLQPHWHPGVEHVTLLSGQFMVGMGDKWDDSKLGTLPAGTFAHIAPHTTHFAKAKGDTIIQLHGIGPWKLVYVNPADDPSKKK